MSCLLRFQTATIEIVQPGFWSSVRIVESSDLRKEAPPSETVSLAVSSRSRHPSVPSQFAAP